MTDKRNIEGVKFILKLDMSADDERKLVQLAKEAIDDSTSIKLGAAIGSGHAMMNNNLSTNDKLYMVMNKYIKLMQQKSPKITKEKALDNFCKIFAAEFPNEYGIKNIPNRSIGLNAAIIKKGRELI